MAENDFGVYFIFYETIRYYDDN